MDQKSPQSTSRKKRLLKKKKKKNTGSLDVPEQHLIGQSEAIERNIKKLEENDMELEDIVNDN